MKFYGRKFLVSVLLITTFLNSRFHSTVTKLSRLSHKAFPLSIGIQQPLMFAIYIAGGRINLPPLTYLSLVSFGFLTL